MYKKDQIFPSLIAAQINMTHSLLSNMVYETLKYYLCVCVCTGSREVQNLNRRAFSEYLAFKLAFYTIGMGPIFTGVKGTHRETKYSPLLSAWVKIGEDLSPFLHMY
jgi:hypothetical protein